MNYTRLIQDAWTITWRYRFLWLLGLFSGASAGTCSGSNFNFNFPGSWTADGDEDAAPFPPDLVFRWLGENLTLVIAAAATILVVMVLLLIVSIIAQGGMAQATADLARGRPSSLRAAVQAGLRLFWRYFGLWLILTALTIVIALLAAGLVAGVVALAWVAGDILRIIVVVLGVLAAIAAVFVVIAVSILFGIVVAYAQRAIAVEDIGPIAALRQGAILLRDYVGRSLLIWLISLAIGIAIGLVSIVVFIVVALPLALVGGVLYAVLGLHFVTMTYIGIAAVLFVAAMWLLSAIANAYNWSYWTLAYLWVSGHEL